jgi:hypothetical protein
VDTAFGYVSAALAGWKTRAGTGSEDTAAVVVGGRDNRAMDKYSFVGGGWQNTASLAYGAVVGGFANWSNGAYATVVGGQGNQAMRDYATVGGGDNNYATGYAATVGGGSVNVAETSYATVGGGFLNDASGYSAAVSGGEDNEAAGLRATVGGGYSNRSSGAYSTVPGGAACYATGNHSFAAGTLARARGTGSFVWSDSCSIADSVSATGANQWRARARGGAWFYSNLGMTTGAYLAPGSNAWTSACDSVTKEDFREVDRQELLDKVAALRVRNYKMRDQDDGTRHIGPVAQDFHAAFGVGETDKGINMADADGVLLAAVQALYEQNQLQQAEIEGLKAELVRMK